MTSVDYCFVRARLPVTGQHLVAVERNNPTRSRMSVIGSAAASAMAREVVRRIEARLAGYAPEVAAEMAALRDEVQELEQTAEAGWF